MPAPDTPKTPAAPARSNAADEPPAEPRRPRSALDEDAPAAAAARAQRTHVRRAALAAFLRTARESSVPSPAAPAVDRDAARAAAREAARESPVVTAPERAPPAERARMRRESALRARLFYGDAAAADAASPGQPQPDTRARAWSAAAEVRAARAAQEAARAGQRDEVSQRGDERAVAREEAAARASLFQRAGEGRHGARRRERDRVLARRERNARAALFARARPQPVASVQTAGDAHARLIGREEALLQRATLHGEVGADAGARLRELKRARGESEKKWQVELEEIAGMLDEVEKKGTQCVIDLSLIQKGELAVRLPCLHVFHADCMMPYLSVNEAPVCPIDRCPVPKSIVPYLPVWPWGEDAGE